MTNFNISFDQPWLMLLLIPALGLTLLTYFLLAKRYRRTRNRIISMVLHMVVMLLCICVLSGMRFNYFIPNPENEIILLVDVSDTARESQEQREEFMQAVINESQYYNFKVGVVTFGFTQEYAVPMTDDAESIFPTYQNAPLPDTSATDIAAALRYASGLFTYQESGKIVLISDGKETDETATAVIRSISARGIKIDTACISSDYSSDNVQVVGVQYPTYHINVGEECSIGVELTTKNGAHSTTVELWDNGELDAETGSQTVDLVSGSQMINFRKAFDSDGLHQIRVAITESGDQLEENNSYCSYIYLEVYDRVLVIDQGVNDGESNAIFELLGRDDAIPGLNREEGAGYKVEFLHLHTSENVPSTIDYFLNYDQIILNNISSADLVRHELEGVLYSYVYEYGGGLFTVGGNEADGKTAHAYNRFDLKNTLLQQMLPVQAVEYTPPVGLVIVIDVSGSMSDKLDWAKNGAVACLSVMTERDYIGVITLESDYHTELQLTSRTEETTIKETINDIKIGGSTKFAPAITRAGQALVAEDRVDRRHVVIITDGYPTDKEEDYLPEVDRFFRKNGVTFSVVGFDMSEGSDQAEKMTKLTSTGHGRLHYADSEQALLASLINDLNAPEIKESEEKKFHPIVANELSQVVNNVEYGRVRDYDEDGNVIAEKANALSTTLDGFYGVRARDRAETIIVGEHEVPIYAQWKFGKGNVGSFMCDLSGKWSKDLLADENGQRLILNIVSNLMPTTNIRPSSIRLTLDEENYFNHLNIYTTLEEGETVQGKLIEYDSEGGEIVTSLNQKAEDTDGAHLYVTVDLNEENRFTRSTFVVKRSGVYKIVVEKCDKSGKVLATAEVFKSFSYSKEYDTRTEVVKIAPVDLMAELAVKGNGAVISLDAPTDGENGVFRDTVTGISRTWDPALTFMIIASVLFLGDIAVRKFKFKWIHEIVRERRDRKASGQKATEKKV